MIHSQGSILRYALALTMASLVATAGTTTALASSSSSGATISSTQATSKVDVNNADLKTLETLPGVGPSLAKKIVSGRPYSNLSDLAHVKGMGQKKANALKHHVTFGAASGATTASTKKTHATTSGRSTGSYTTPSPAESSSGSEPSSSEPSSSEPSASSSHPSASSSHLAPGQTVDINTASAEELDKLPGIGPSKAEAIVDYRNAHGNFKSVDDIKNVPGIKEGTFSKIQNYITVGQ